MYNFYHNLNTILNIVYPFSEVTDIFPLWFVTIFFAIAKPNPYLLSFLFLDSSIR